MQTRRLVGKTRWQGALVAAVALTFAAAGCGTVERSSSYGIDLFSGGSGLGYDEVVFDYPLSVFPAYDVVDVGFGVDAGYDYFDDGLYVEEFDAGYDEYYDGDVYYDEYGDEFYYDEYGDEVYFDDYGDEYYDDDEYEEYYDEYWP